MTFEGQPRWNPMKCPAKLWPRRNAEVAGKRSFGWRFGQEVWPWRDFLALSINNVFFPKTSPWDGLCRSEWNLKNGLSLRSFVPAHEEAVYFFVFSPLLRGHALACLRPCGCWCNPTQRRSTGETAGWTMMIWMNSTKMLWIRPLVDAWERCCYYYYFYFFKYYLFIFILQRIWDTKIGGPYFQWSKTGHLPKISQKSVILKLLNSPGCNGASKIRVSIRVCEAVGDLSIFCGISSHFAIVGSQALSGQRFWMGCTNKRCYMSGFAAEEHAKV